MHTTEELLMALIRLANETMDGHSTIMKFTTGYKAFLGTPDLSRLGRDALWRMKSQPTLDAALKAVLRANSDKC